MVFKGESINNSLLKFFFLKYLFNSRFMSAYTYMLYYFFQVLSVLSTIEHSASDMLCFDLEDTLFVRNKWDCVDAGRQTRDELKMIITDRMRAELPWVRESQIFDTCLRKVWINSTAIVFFFTLIFIGNYGVFDFCIRVDFFWFLYKDVHHGKKKFLKQLLFCSFGATSVLYHTNISAITNFSSRCFLDDFYVIPSWYFWVQFSI